MSDSITTTTTTTTTPKFFGMADISKRHIETLITKLLSDPKKLVEHHIESYNYFINYELPKIFSSEDVFEAVTKDTIYRYKFDSNCFVSNPVSPEDDGKNEFTPLDAEQRNLSYTSTVYVTIYEEIVEKGNDEVKSNVYQNFPIAQIPTMVHSTKCNLYKKTKKELIAIKECPLNPGGYFVTNGVPRTVIAQERANFNQTYVVYNNSKGKNTFHIEIRSVKDGAIKPQKCVITTNSHTHQDDENMYFTVSFGSTKDVEVGVIFALLECEWDIKEIFDYENKKIKNIMNYLISSVPDSYEDAVHILLKHQTETKYKNTPKEIIDNEFLPHMETIKGKLQFLIGMLRKLIDAVIGKRGEDDRDNFSNKRLDVTGVLLRDLFRLSLKKWIQKHIQMMSKQSNAKTNFERNTFITDTITRCINTGTWGLQKSPHTRTGVCQLMSTGNRSAFISHSKRFTTPIGREGGTLKKIRYLHSGQWGSACPNESPDGPKIGIIKNLAQLAKVTVETSTATVIKTARNILDKLQFKYVDDIDRNINFSNDWCLYINGKLIGMFLDTDNTYQFVHTLKSYRRYGIIFPETSICCDKFDKEIKIFTDSGRFVRPVFVLDDGKLTITPLDIIGKDFHTLVKEGHIQWIDSLESEFSICATTFLEVINNYPKIKYNYVELHPSIILGSIAAMIPFPQFSQSPRNCYASNMIKQSQGAIGFNYMYRFLTTQYSLWYPQKPLVTTQMSRILNFEELPSAISANVAVMCRLFNQEDSLIVKDSFLQRGGAVSVVYCVIDIKEKRKGPQKYETIEIPPVTVMKKNANYNKLDIDGIVCMGVKVTIGDVLVGKTYMNNGVKVDCSYIISSGEEGVVDKVILTTSGGNKLVKIKIRNTRVPICGDKLAAFNGQKATIGQIESEENMPFNYQGITPDIILSPEALPSRMTLNYILEMIIGKALLFEDNDEFKDCTAFNMTDSKKVLEYVGKVLKKNGFKSTGSEPMTCGMTGRQLPAMIFMGPMGYMRLKHMVVDKVHSRGTGKVQVISMQPTSGRSNDGGLRFGEMETANAICYGNSRFLFERLLEVSDQYNCNICTECKMICQKKCDTCEYSKIVSTKVPYVMKLLFQELMSTGIKVSLKV